MKNTPETIAAISTPPGTGGIGIIRISGKEAFKIGIGLFREKKKNSTLSQLNSESIKNRYLYYGIINDPLTQEIIDEVLIAFMKGPGSYTAEDVVEIQAHSGRFILKKILSLVIESGASIAEPGEFTKRAFLNGRISLTQAEAVMDIISSDSSASHKMALSISQGELGKKVNSAKDIIMDIEASITACVDFPDDVDDILDLDLINKKIESVREIFELLKKNHDSGHQLREGLKISIVGPPNAGKSSLLNRLVSRERSIVTAIPGTTRDVIEESVILNGFPLVLSDTAGIRDTEDDVEKIGVLRSRETLKSSDLVIFVIDGKNGFSDDAKVLFEEIKIFPYIFVVNKKDLIDEEQVFKNQTEESINPVYISALKNSGIDDLKKSVFDFFENNFSGLSSSIIPNQRHYDLILKIISLLDSVKEQMDIYGEFELISYDLKNIIDLCSGITGDLVSPDILDKVFSDFCIGK